MCPVPQPPDRTPRRGAGVDAHTEARSPAWIGIGAQRSGTTWFTDLLCSHPDVVLPKDGRKESHWFDRFLVDRFTADDGLAYRASFPAAVAAGEFTPAYLRSSWVAPLVRASCGAAPLLIVLLRDPIDRFRSALRWSMEHAPVPPANDVRARGQWSRRIGNQAVWGGMYAVQLSAWREWFPRERFLVLQYESLRADPAATVGRAWRALGLDPVPLAAAPGRTWNSTTPAATTTGPEGAPVAEGVEPALRAQYEPEVRRLVDEWGIDRSLWPHFA